MTHHDSKPSGLYLATIERFAEAEDCTPPDELSFLATLQNIAKRFGKSPEEVASDINQIFLESYRPPTMRELELLDAHDYFSPVRPSHRSGMDKGRGP